MARKLGVTQSELSDFISEHDSSLSLNAHKRIEEPILGIIIKQYDPTGEKMADKPAPIENAIDQNDTEAEIQEISDQDNPEENSLPVTEEIQHQTAIGEILVEDEVPEEIEGQTVQDTKIEAKEELIVEQTIEIEDTTVAEVPTAIEESVEIESFSDTENGSNMIPTDPDLDAIEREFYEKRAILDRDAEGNEVIRAKLQKLEGIKVVGKIELPPPPKPKEKSEEDNKNKERKSKRESSDKRRRKPETLKDKQEREKRREERERKKLEKQLKAKKRKHYIKKIEKKGANKPSSSKNIRKATKSDNNKNRQPVNQKSRNPVKRFWHWLNGKYDSY
ncbi:MAG: hypothetical protein WBA74_13960 [Cyclobacteriaceae bacterium]